MFNQHSLSMLLVTSVKMPPLQSIFFFITFKNLSLTMRKLTSSGSFSIFYLFVSVRLQFAVSPRADRKNVEVAESVGVAGNLV